VLKKVQVSYVELRTDQVENMHVFEIVEFKKGSPKKSATGEWDTSRCNEVVITSVCKKCVHQTKKVQVCCGTPCRWPVFLLSCYALCGRVNSAGMWLLPGLGLALACTACGRTEDELK